jgi:hypothetical protein
MVSRKQGDGMTEHETLLQEVIEWSERQRELMLRQVELMKSGKMHIADSNDHSSVDETNFWIIENERRIAEFDELFAAISSEDAYADRS